LSFFFWTGVLVGVFVVKGVVGRELVPNTRGGLVLGAGTVVVVASDAEVGLAVDDTAADVAAAAAVEAAAIPVLVGAAALAGDLLSVVVPVDARVFRNKVTARLNAATARMAPTSFVGFLRP